MASAAFSQTAPLSFRPVDAEYSATLDRIIMVSASPNQLHIYNPVTKADTTVSLSAAPNAVSVSPDGLFAAVGHNNLITYVNLSNAAVTRTFTVTFNVNDLVLAANYIYLLPTMSIQISSGTVAGAPPSFGAVARGVLSPGEQAIYWVLQYSPYINRASTATGLLTNPQTSPYNGSGCNNYNNSSIWLADSILYTSCGSAFEASPEMRFAPALSGLLSISGLASAPGLRAAIPASYTDYNFSPPQLFSDNEVHLLSGLPPLPQGRFVLPDFFSGNNSFVAHGRWLFFDSAGSKIFTVMQADGASGLLNDFAVQTTSLTPGSCSTVLTPAQLSAPGTGTLLATSVTSAGNCAYRITSNVPWIKTVTNYGGGPNIVNLLVRPNSGAARSGTVTIGSDNLTVSQDAAPTASNLTPLSFKVVTAEFSKSQNKLLLAARAPNELHLINPATLADQIVPLSFVPRSVALAPDGNTAAVGGDGAVVFVNVANGAVTGPYRVPTEATGIILPGNGYAFLYTTRSNPISILISTGVYTVTTNPASPPVRLSSGGRYGYSTGNGIYKWDFLPAGTATLVGQVPNPVDLGNNTNFWFSEDGIRLFTSSARAYRTSDNLSTDLLYNGMLADANFLSWAANSTAVKTTAVTTFSQYSSNPDTELILYGDEFLGLLSKTTLPSLTGPSGIAYPSKGRFVFWNAASDKLIVVVQADAQTALTADYAVYVISAGNCALNSLVSTNAAFAVDGGASQFPISASPGCAWKAASNATWLTINSGGFGISSASVGYTVAANASGATRTGIINVSGLDFTVTQSAGTLTLNPTALSFAGIGGTASVAVTASAPTVAWSAQSTVPWITITSSASGTGSGTVGYAVAGNPFSTSRTGTITIGGVTFTVTQAGSTGAVTFGANYLGFNGEAVSYTVQVISTASWVAASTVPWLRITSPANGVASGSRGIDFTLDRNPGPGSRYGTIVVNGQVVQISQSEAPPTVTFDPTTIAVNASGSSGSIRFTSSSTSYYWSAYSNATWVTLVAPTSGSGSGNISYAVAANTATAARSAIIFINTQAVTVNQSGVAAPPPPLTTGLHFVRSTPCRVADTREDRASGLGKPALVGGSARDFNITAACGIPATARAYSLNITVVPKGPLGYISIWPAGTPQPLVSTLNSLDGRIKANAALVPAGAGGAVSVYATGATELIIDINGYFVEPAAAAPGALAFYPISPCRVVDTRNPNGALSGPIISNGSRDFPIANSACGIPASVQAYSLNTTVVPSGPLGYLTLWPAGQSQPLVSTLNATRGNIVANAAIVPAGTNGAISAYANGSTHLVIDINGYFAPPGAANAMKFFPVTPCRLVDTRNGDGPLGGPILPDSGLRSFSLTSANCGLAQTATAFSINATVVPTAALGYLTLWPTGQPQAFVSTLNALEDAIVANAAIVPAGTNGAISTFVTNRTHLVLDTNGYFAP